MARAPRLRFPGGVYHVTARGNGQRAIFRDGVDREHLLELLTRVVTRYGWSCHAYCEMGNHYHLLIDCPHANLSEGMCLLNGAYTRAFNRRHGLSGHLFGARFNSVVVERESHLLEVARYVVLNPVRAGLCEAPEGWRWSSYPATAGLAEAPALLTTRWLLAQFSSDIRAARDRYRQFVLDRTATNPFDQTRPSRVLGSEGFAARVRNHSGHGSPHAAT